MKPMEKSHASSAKLSDANSCALLQHPFQQQYAIATYSAYTYAMLLDSELQINLIRPLFQAEIYAVCFLKSLEAKGH